MNADLGEGQEPSPVKYAAEETGWKQENVSASLGDIVRLSLKPRVGDTALW